MTNDYLAQRRARIAAALPLGDAILLVGAGDPVPLPEHSDQTYPFRSHAEYYYLAGRECAGGVIAFDPRDGADGWKDFVPLVTEAERVWEGRGQLPGDSLQHLPGWLSTRGGRPVAWLGSPPLAVPVDTTLRTRVREAFTHSHRVKDATEIGLVKQAVDATAAGFVKLRGLLRPGVSERSLQIELEAEFFRRGAARTGYGTIVGTGPNSAVLHFEPSARAAKDGEFGRGFLPLALSVAGGAEILVKSPLTEKIRNPRSEIAQPAFFTLEMVVTRV
ncbi:MAG: aminopeptidase P N-terminal domain-containing protein [Opitutaceae bacterium]|nr:aminopeptidase P N-terminal domain-containing protein [Opitutaceae bacterium]